MKCQMDNLTDLIDVFPPDLVGSEQSSLQEDKITDVIKSFYSLLFLIFNENLYEKIEENEMKEIIRKNVSKEILLSYKKVYYYYYFFILNSFFRIISFLGSLFCLQSKK